MSRYIDVSNLDIPSDENDYDELVAFADKIAEMIVDAPSIDIEPKRGEWIGEADGYYNGELIYDTWYCSNCDYVVDDEEPPTWNFCPNCGARMKGADHEV